MIKEAINRILEISAPHTVEKYGFTYVDKDMDPIMPPKDSLAACLKVHTLTAISDYIQKGTDKQALPDSRFVIHVADYNHVDLHKELNKDKNREYLIHSCIDVCRFPFGKWMDIETFIINLQSHFVRTETIEALIRLVGNVVDESTVKQSDDGVTQRVTARTGIALVKEVEVPNPVALQPYRTFSEVEQPEGTFVFRVRKNEREGVTAALFEADGEAWKNKAILTIKEWLEGHLRDVADKIIILA